MIRTTTSLVAAGLMLPSLCAVAYGQERLTGVVLTAPSGTRGPARPPAPIVPGMRVTSPSTAWSEIALSDGSSIVLEPSSDLTVQAISYDADGARWTVRGTSTRGSVRYAMSDTAQAVISTPGGSVEITAATAVVQSGENGAVTMIGGSSAVVRQGSGCADTLRRSGFSVRFGSCGTRRDSRRDLAAAVTGFGPVTPSTTEVSAPTMTQAGTSSATAPAAQTRASASSSASASPNTSALSGSAAPTRASASSSASASPNTSALSGSAAPTTNGYTTLTAGSATATPNGTSSSTGTIATTGSTTGQAAASQTFTLASAAAGTGNADQMFVVSPDFTVAAPSTSARIRHLPGYVDLTQTGSGLAGAPIGTVITFSVNAAPPASTSDTNSSNGLQPMSTFISGAIGDSGLKLVSGANARNPALRSSIQVTADGFSTASVSVGGAIPNSASDSSVSLYGQTIASRQASSTGRSAALSASFSSGLLSYRDNISPVPGTGYTTIVTSQAGTIQAAGSANSPSSYSISLPIISSSATQTTIPTLNLSGYTSAVVQSYQNGSGTLYALSSRSLGDVTIVSDPAQTAEFKASLTGAQVGVGTLGISAPVNATSSTIALGGTINGVPATAVVSSSTFAGVAPGLGLSSVDGSTLAGIAMPTGTITIPGTNTAVVASLPPSNEHLAWGFFLGNPTGTSVGASGDYVGLGFWTAGQAVPIGSLATLTGTASYTGGMIGTAVDGTAQTVATRVGQFAQTWDFGKRTATMNAFFDSRAWQNLSVVLPSGSNVYGGSQTSGQRTLTVQGSFFNRGGIASGGSPAATGGQFGITGNNYGANGIFVGTKH